VFFLGGVLRCLADSESPSQKKKKKTRLKSSKAIKKTKNNANKVLFLLTPVT
jgi:hypothetical protein